MKVNDALVPMKSIFFGCTSAKVYSQVFVAITNDSKSSNAMNLLLSCLDIALSCHHNSLKNPIYYTPG